MSAPPTESAALPARWWRAAVAWFRRIWRRAPRQLGGSGSASRARRLQDVFGDGALELEEDLRDILSMLAGETGAVVDTVARAIQDYGHLDRIVAGPGADVDAVFDVTLLADARAVLRGIIVRAPEVKLLLDVAATRSDDRAGRAAAGEAMLSLRDQRRGLEQLASAALRWASSGTTEDRKRMDHCAKRLGSS